MQEFMGTPEALESPHPSSPTHRSAPARTRRARARIAFLAAATAIAAVSAAIPVRAATVELTGGLLLYVADPSVIENSVTVSLASGRYTIDDPSEQTFLVGAPATAAGCAPFDSNTLTCPESAITSFDIRTGQGNDTVSLTNAIAPAVVRGDFGADTLTGGDADDVFVWTPGGGNDVILGGPGTDTLEFQGSNGNERIQILDDGESGDAFLIQRDIASISLRAGSVEALELMTFGGQDDVTTRGLRSATQTLIDGADGLADILRIDAEGFCVTREGDAFSFEGRNPIAFTEFAQTSVVDDFCRTDPCESAVATAGCTVNGARNQPCEGTTGDDLIVGTRDADVIKGGGGRDRIRGGDGDDLLCGDEGDDDLTGSSDDDTLAGGAGDDDLNGGGGFDTLIGGDDDDDLTGGGDDDELDGGPGDDTLRGGGDVDSLRGGIGEDRLDGGASAADVCRDPDPSGPFLRCP
jgi:Ca2+-binding RTX toxin-like protein